ncbi:MAG: DUF932 domain-containing protein [Bacteroidales bacterium]
MNIEEAKILEEYKFPVSESQLYFPSNDNLKKSQSHKAIVRNDTGELISVMKNSYKMISNERIIDSVTEQLEKLNTPWRIDKQSSYLDNSNMRLHIVFPDLAIQDHESKIFLSLMLINSYDGSEAYSLKKSMLRQICTNGMTARTLLGKEIKQKHTQRIANGNLMENVEGSFKKLPLVKLRIEEMLNTPITRDIKLQIEDKMGTNVSKFVSEQLKTKRDNLYDLYNHLTYWISHLCSKKQQMNYHNEVSTIFQL